MFYADNADISSFKRHIKYMRALSYKKLTVWKCYQRGACRA